MSIEIVRSPNSKSLVFNPVKFRIETIDEPILNLELSVGDRNVYTFSHVPFNNIVEFDIAEILSNYVQSYIIQEADSIVIPVAGFMIQYNLTITGNTVASFSGYALYGGIGKSLFRKLDSLSLDMFSYRLSNYERQFFFTTRTNGRNIHIRESEIMPLLFIAPNVSISLVSDRGRVVVISGLNSGELYALNLIQLRKFIYVTYSEIVSFFSILINDLYTCDISFTPGRVNLDKRILLFRNSLGSYEKLELSGLGNQSSEWDPDMDFMKYDPVISDFIYSNERINFRDTIQAQTGFNSFDEFLFIRDMLSSDDVYLIENGYNRAVQVSTDEFNIPLRITEPISIPINIKFKDKENASSPEFDLKPPTGALGEWILESGSWNMLGFWYSNKTWKFNK